MHQNMVYNKYINSFLKTIKGAFIQPSSFNSNNNNVKNINMENNN